MSINQSRSDKNDGHYRKSGARSGSSAQQRTFSVGAGKGGGNAPPSSAFVPSSSLSSNRSFKRPNNAQGGQSRVSVGAANSESANPSSQQRGIQNGVHTQPSSHGVSDAPAGKPTDSAPQRISRAPKAPSSKVPSSYTAAVSSDTASQTAPDNAPDDSRLQFSLQFGSINPGFVNGMQIPARTSSAPPNLDEQKRDQARHDTFIAVPTLPLPSNPKQHLPRKGVIASEQSNAGEAHPLSKGKRDVQVSSASPANQAQKPSVLPMTGISMQIPYHQPQVSVQFSGPNPQLQSQGMTATSLQMPMPMPLQMGNASQVQQQVFVPGLQPHPLQPQGMIHQGQGLSFTTPMGPQLSPQLGNLQMGMTPQYTQQQPGKFGGPRKTTVKITHPDTHEELRLDKRADPYLDGGSSGPSGPRSHPNLPPPSQSIPSFTPPHPINFYTNSYNASSLFFPSPSSLPLTSTPLTSSTQTPRFNYPVSQGPPTGPFINAPTHNSLSVSKTGTAMQGVAEPLNLEHARDVHNVMSSVLSSTSQVTIKPAVVSVVEKVTDALPPLSSAATEKVESPKLLRLPGETSSFHLPRNTDINSETSLQQPKTDLEPSTSTLLPGASKQFSVATDTVSVESSASTTLSSAPIVLSDENASVVTSNEGRRRETLGRSNSIKEHQKKTGKKGHPQPQQQVGGQTASLSNLPSRPMERGISSKIGVTETLEPKAVHGTLGNSEDVLDFTREPVSTITADSADASELKADSFGEGSAHGPPKTPGAGITNHTKDTRNEKQSDFSLQNELSKHSTVAIEGQGESEFPEGFKQDAHCLEKSSESISSISLEAVKQPVPDSELKVTTSSVEVGLVETAQEVDVSVSCCTEIDRTTENSVAPTPTTLESINVETVPSNAVLPTSSYGDKNSSFDASLSRSDSIGVKEIIVAKSAASDQESVPVPTPYLSESTVKPEGAGVENGSGGLVSHPVSSSKDKPTVELNRPKTTVKKKKRKEILQKADAAGTTSDLYMAYKGPEEKKETIISSESTSAGNVKQVSADAGQEDVVGSDKGEQPKAEPDDWEDAADISTPKLETQDNGVANGGSMLDDKDGNGVLGKKYSRDFLLTFADQCNDLPEGFEITSDIAEALMISNINMSHLIDRDSYPSPGRIVDRQAGGSRPDRRGSGVVDDDKWSKLPGPFSSGRDLRPDIGYGGNVVGFRSVQGGNYGVLRNPRGQSTMQYVGGILSGPMQSMGSQGGQRNSPDADRWQRATGFQKGLIPSPQTSVQMHRAEKKYEVGKATDEEEVKQRKLKAILNKLTPQNFEKLFEQVKAVNIDNAVTLTGVISQIFDKALMEPTFCEMYANFCFHLAGELPDFSEDNEKITFKRLLLNKCQEEFERGEREQEEANRADEEGEIKQSEEEREEKRIKARRRMLGNIRLIGELYKKRMLTERIMHECIKKLLGQYQNPDEEDVESLCKLMSTIGEMIDHPKAKEHMDVYFDRMAKLSNNMKLSSRVRFMLKDAIDLRKNKWQQRRKVEGPKKIEEVHRDAAQERQAQASRLSRGPSMNSSTRRGAPPMDFGPRGSTMLSSPNSQMGGFRGLPSPQVRGFGAQDVRLEDRQSYESRTPSVPLPHRPIGDDSITLGPQGGLARGMSIRGPPAMSSGPLGDISPGSGDSRRLTAGLNGYSSLPDRTTYSSREEIMPRYIPERFGGPSAYDQSSTQDRNLQYGNRDVRTPDRGFDRSLATSPPARAHGPAVSQNVPPEKVWPEERLRDMSIAAIKEFYSAKDENEVALCIKDLNSPGFYPSMVSIWVTDSFERKDKEMDMLAKLLVNLTKSRDAMLSQVQLIKGFEAVLTALEDAVNDAPKAAEFLGRIFAMVIIENVIPLRELGQIILEGGEEPGRLREIGLAAEVLGSTLEIIKSEKGENVLNEIRKASNLRLDDFRPPDPSYRSAKLDKFI
ncbi:hypothetical protein AAG906_038996 [Vitis piasezkii]